MIEKNSHLPGQTRTKVLLIGLFVLLAQVGQVAFGRSFDENQVKAVFLLNLTKFVQWPEQRLDEGREGRDFCIGILGTSPFDTQLKQVMAGESVQGRQVRVVSYHELRDVPWAKTDLLLVGRNFQSQMDSVRQRAVTTGVLTVGDYDGFGRAGGMVNFLAQDGRIVVWVNPLEVRSAGLKIRAQLMRLARIVTTGEEKR